MRTLRMAIVSAFIQNPMSQMYFTFVVPHADIRKYCPPGKAMLLNSIFRSLLHFSVIGPIANTNALIFPEYLSSFDFEKAHANWKAKIWTAMSASFCYWPFVHFVNYMFVPPHLRQPMVDMSAFFYSVFISYLANKKIKEEHSE